MAERELWQAVLSRAVRDIDYHEGDRRCFNQQNLNRANALAYFTLPCYDIDLSIVCYMAELDKEFVKDQARRKICKEVA